MMAIHNTYEPFSSVYASISSKNGTSWLKKGKNPTSLYMLISDQNESYETIKEIPYYFFFSHLNQTINHYNQSHDHLFFFLIIIYLIKKF